MTSSEQAEHAEQNEQNEHAEQGERSTGPLSAFVIALPPGWVRLPVLASETEVLRGMIEEIIAEVLPATLPRDATEPWRGEFRKRLSTAAAEAADAGASAIYLPVTPVNGVVLPVSIIESEVEDEAKEDAGSVILDLLGSAGADGEGGELRMLDGARAARTETVSTKVKPHGDWPVVTTRQVVFTIETPHRRGRWVVMSFSAVSGDNPSAALSDALVLLFDALIGTLRWVDAPGAEHSALEARLREIKAVHPDTTAVA